MPAYTQGIMDLGATLCTRSAPACTRCPVRVDCVAFAGANPGDYPVKTRKIKRSSQSLWLLCASTHAGEVCLQQRPAKGVWASLFTQPLFDSAEQILAAVPKQLHAQLRWAPAFVHVLTHKDLHLHVCYVDVKEPVKLAEGAWYSALQWPLLGLPAPVRQLLAQTS